jgi:hypothetical protein
VASTAAPGVTPVPVTPTTATPAAPVVPLQPDGLGVARIGDDMHRALANLTPVLGLPTDPDVIAPSGCTSQPSRTTIGRPARSAGPARDQLRRAGGNRSARLPADPSMLSAGRHQ